MVRKRKNARRKREEIFNEEKSIKRITCNKHGCFLAACGSKEEATDNAAGGSTAAATETADAADTTSADDAIANLIAATEGTVDIQLWCSELESYQTVMKELTDKFGSSTQM